MQSPRGRVRRRSAARGTAGGAGPVPAAAVVGPHRTRRRLVAAVLLVAVVWLGQSLGRALTGPGTDSVSARVAEWARFHHLGGIVTELERLQYDLHKPRTGGALSGGIPAIAPGSAPSAAPSAAPTRAQAGLPAPAPVMVQASPALPHEGDWQTISTVHGLPALREAFLRPDAAHSSYLAGVAWMDPTLLHFVLHPGTQVPGRSGWPEPPLVTASPATGLLATFNSGFTMQDARGGFWEGGEQVDALRAGAASLVLHTDGSVDVEAWTGGATPGPGIAAVRQNLDLLVDGRALAPGIDSNSNSKWGATLGNNAYVWRSAIGVTSTGALVYVAGPALSTRSLGQLELAAGAVRAMELDINPEWTSFMTYAPGSGTAAGMLVPHKLTADEQNSATRYLRTSTRDFLAVYAR